MKRLVTIAAVALCLGACASSSHRSSSGSTPSSALAEPARTAVACWQGTERTMSKCMAAWEAAYPMGSTARDDALRTALGNLDGCTAGKGLKPTQATNPFPVKGCEAETQAAIEEVTKP